MSEILVAQDLCKDYGKFRAVNKVSFHVEKGEVFALIGPNGAGKTSTIRMIATLLKPSEGDATVCGHSIVRNPAEVRRSITYLPDEAGAYKNMTGWRYLRFMASLFTNHADEREAMVQYAATINELGDRLGDKVGSYSRGMIRKLLLSRAVMSKPALAIFDEPTSGLDILNALEIRRMIKNLAEDGMSFLITSHNMLEIEFVSDRVAIIDKGSIHLIGKPSELKEKYSASNLEEVFERAVSQ